MQFTPEQIIKLAPDEASVKAGKALATNAKWQLRCVHEKALWGDCQGSGKTPYRSIVDLTSLAFKCSCPSRKFPCKHGLGLLFLYAANPAVFSVETELAPHVKEWLDKRETRTEAKITTSEKTPDEEGQQKRAELRERKVSTGMEELRLWLKDTIRTGIMNVPQNPYQFNQNIIARMVDSQAGGLAGQLRKINRINFYAEGWQKSLIKQLSKTYLLTESYKNIRSLPEGLQTELRTQIGWNISKEEVLKTTGIQDDWLVLAISSEEEANLRTERIWLYGIEIERYALILNFYAGAQVSSHKFIEGGIIKGELFYYPSETPLRAVMKEPFDVKNSFTIPAVSQSVTVLFEKVSRVLSVNPFAEQIPFMLYGLKVYFDKTDWFVMDSLGKVLPLSNTDDECWKLLSISRGKDFMGFGIYENQLFNMHALWSADKYYSLK